MINIWEKTRSVFLTGLLALSAMFLVACDDGPMENAGEEIDDVADEIEDGLD